MSTAEGRKVKETFVELNRTQKPGYGRCMQPLCGMGGAECNGSTSACPVNAGEAARFHVRSAAPPAKQARNGPKAQVKTHFYDVAAIAAIEARDLVMCTHKESGGGLAGQR